MDLGHRRSPSSGLSVHQIAAATGLSSSLAHQLVGSDEAREIPRWLSQQRRRGSRVGPMFRPASRAKLEAIRRCRVWSECLEWGDGRGEPAAEIEPEPPPKRLHVQEERAALSGTQWGVCLTSEGGDPSSRMDLAQAFPSREGLEKSPSNKTPNGPAIGSFRD